MSSTFGTVYRSLAGKMAEKMKESDANLRKRFVADYAKNDRLEAVMEVSAEQWPTIGNLNADPRKRVSALDELIHGTAIFTGRLRQNPRYGEMIAYWERAHGYWENFALLDMDNLLPEESLPTVEIPLSDGTILLVKDQDSGSVLSKKEHDLRLSLFANLEIMPRGRLVWAHGVSDDRDVSEQYALWIEQPKQAMPAQPFNQLTPVQNLPPSPKPERTGKEFANRQPEP